MKFRVVGATVFGVLLVIGAYFYTNFYSPQTEEGSLVVGERTSPVRGYIQTADQDGDGVPDWRAALRTTDPLTLDEVSTSTYEIPDTLTDQFAIELFTQMIQAKTFGEYGKSSEEIIAEANLSLQEEAADTLIGTDQILLGSDDSIEAMHLYANEIAAISLRNGIPRETQNEGIILDQALRANDPEQLEELDVIINSYEGMLADTKALPVPPTLTQQHLDLLNAYQAILNDVLAMRVAFEDPLRALLRIQRYQDDASGLYYAFTNVFKAAAEAGVEYTEGDTVLLVIRFDS